MEEKKLISVIVPCYNEQEVLPLFYDAITDISAQMQEEHPELEFEYVFIDDGSKDGTLKQLRVMAQDPRVRYISFSRNFGKEAGIYAGLKKSRGDYCVVMDADLQHPPAFLPKMYEAVSSGYYDCATTRRVSRAGESKVRSWFARLFYRIMNRISQTEIVDGAQDFRFMTRQMVDAVLSMSEYNRFSKGIFSWVGFRVKYLEYENVERAAGTSAWSFWGLFRYSLEGILGFSTAPLTATAVIGFISCLIGLILLIFTVCKRLIVGGDPLGYPTTTCCVVFFGGLQVFCTGILGLYLAKTYLEVKRRPIYIERENEENKDQFPDPVFEIEEKQQPEQEEDTDFDDEDDFDDAPADDFADAYEDDFDDEFSDEEALTEKPAPARKAEKAAKDAEPEDEQPKKFEKTAKFTIPVKLPKKKAEDNSHRRADEAFARAEQLRKEQDAEFNAIVDAAFAAEQSTPEKKAAAVSREAGREIDAIADEVLTERVPAKQETAAEKAVQPAKEQKAEQPVQAQKAEKSAPAKKEKFEIKIDYDKVDNFDDEDDAGSLRRPSPSELERRAQKAAKAKDDEYDDFDEDFDDTDDGYDDYDDGFDDDYDDGSDEKQSGKNVSETLSDLWKRLTDALHKAGESIKSKAAELKKPDADQPKKKKRVDDFDDDYDDDYDDYDDDYDDYDDDYDDDDYDDYDDDYDDYDDDYDDDDYDDDFDDDGRAGSRGKNTKKNGGSKGKYRGTHY